MCYKQKLFKRIAWLTASSFMWSCAGYKSVLIHPDDLASQGNRVLVVHWNNHTSELTRISIQNGILKGTLVPQQQHLKGRTIHAYIDMSVSDHFKTGQILIPVSEIYRFETFELDESKTLMYTMLAIGVVTTIFAILLANYEFGVALPAIDIESPWD